MLVRRCPVSTFTDPVADVLWPYPEDDEPAYIRVHQTQHNDRRTRKRHVTVVLNLAQAQELVATLQQRIERVRKGPAR